MLVGRAARAHRRGAILRRLAEYPRLRGEAWRRPAEYLRLRGARARWREARGRYPEALLLPPVGNLIRRVEPLSRTRVGPAPQAALPHPQGAIPTPRAALRHLQGAVPTPQAALLHRPGAHQVLLADPPQILEVRPVLLVATPQVERRQLREEAHHLRAELPHPPAVVRRPMGEPG